MDLTNGNLKYKYRVPSGSRGRSYRSSDRAGTIKPKGEKVDGALARIIRDEKKAQRERQSHIKVTLVLIDGRKRRFVREYI